MRVLVTGGAGFVGSHVCEVLRENGHLVTIWDRKLGSEILEQFLCVDVDAVIHCAAKADISLNWMNFTERDEIFEDNCEATFRLLELCVQSDIRSFVFVSTGAVYGSEPFADETKMLNPESPYAASKVAGESLAQAYAHKAGWRWYCARMVSCVGARYTHGHVVDFVKMAQEGEIIAKDMGAHPKDFMHVRDAAECLVHMATGDLPSGIYNVAAHQRWSWRDTVRVMGVRASCVDQPAGWVGDPIGLGLNANKINRYWTHKRRVEDGVREALETLGWKPPEFSERFSWQSSWQR